jgi:hypothetical protein
MVPCDDGGLAACPYMRSHRMSPGQVVLGEADLLALEVHQSCQALGQELALALLDLTLTTAQAEGLRMRLEYLAHMERLQHARKRQE